MIFKNIIFLDIDGVLNNDGCFIRCNHIHLDDVCVKLLYDTIKQIDNIKLVISSSWRSSPDDVKSFLKYCRDYGNNLFDLLVPYLHEDYCTKRLWKDKRGYEIKEWLSRHSEVEKYICLDDDSDYLRNQPLLQINRNIGFGREDQMIVLTYFNAKSKDDRNYGINTQRNYIKYGLKILNRKQKFLEKFQ